jgi:hypothetical protein
LFFFVISSALSWGQNQGIALAPQVQGGVALSRAYSFPLKAQGTGQIGFLALFPLSPRLKLGTALAYHLVWPSTPSYGIIYRGFAGSEVHIFLAILWPGSGSRSPRLTFALEPGLRLRLDRYLYTQLRFFYTGVSFTPSLDLSWPSLKGQSLFFTAPLNFYFRRDIGIFTTAGFGVGWKIYPAELRKGKRF